MEPRKKYKLGIGVSVAVAVVYLLLPIDVVPDGIPVAGFVDDVAVVLASAANAIRIAHKLKKKETK